MLLSRYGKACFGRGLRARPFRHGFIESEERSRDLGIKPVAAGADVVGFDFSGVSFSRMQFGGIILAGVDFTTTDLRTTRYPGGFQNSAREIRVTTSSAGHSKRCND